LVLNPKNRKKNQAISSDFLMKNLTGYAIEFRLTKMQKKSLF
jgi:hypothetical protein